MTEKGMMTDAGVKLRYKDLGLIASNFCEARNSKFYEIVIDDAALYMTTSSACQDIDRYKAYHQENPGVDKLNAVKRAAFFSKWIVKFKPLIVMKKDNLSDKDDLSFLLNEELAIYYSETVIQDCIKKPVNISPSIMTDLMYSLLYRGLDENALILFYQAIHDTANGDPILTE